MSMFSTPTAPGEGIKWADLNGSLLLAQVHRIESGIQTVHGASDAVVATVTVLDGPQAGEVYEDALVFPKLLRSQLTKKVGELVLGRLGQGNAKPGQSAPWLLNPHTPQDVKVAEDHMRKTANTPSVASAEAPF